MNQETSNQTASAPAVASSGLFCFRWWYKGRTVEGNTIKLEGRVVADCATTACSKVETAMRQKHPTIRWMQGREIEGNGVSFGPTVQKLKTPVEAAKQNAEVSESAREKSKP